MQKKLAALALVLSLTAGASAAMAQERLRSSTTPSIFSGFGDEERRIILDWFHNSNNTNGLPASVAKPEHLPAGLQKQLTKNGTLPDGLERKIQPLPRSLELKLPRLPAGRRRVLIAGNVILLDERTSMIVDIIPGVV